MLWERLLRRITYPWRISAIVLALLAGNVGWAAHRHPGAIPIEVVGALSLLALRRNPLAVLAVQFATIAPTEVLYRWSNPVGVWITLCTVAIYKPRRTSLAAVGVTLLVALATHQIHHPAELAAREISVLAAWVIGDTIRSRRAWLKREREQDLRQATTDEQARISRELHDVIAHNVSVMVVQAAAAGDVFDTQPEQARESLRSIEQTGREALTELRRLLGTMRAPEQDVYAPQPGLGSLDALVSRIRAAGLPVAVHVDGSLAELPAGPDLSAYRIVQEALTNTLKHAGASRAEVGVRRTETALELEIVDDGVGNGNGDGGGHGLIGMRERAALVGGEVEAGPRPGGGFQVRARLPL